MIRPGITFLLWLAIAAFVVLNDAIGDTWIGAALSVRAVEWYKALVPLPYAAMLAIIHARRTAGFSPSAAPDASGAGPSTFSRTRRPVPAFTAEGSIAPSTIPSGLT